MDRNYAAGATLNSPPLHAPQQTVVDMSAGLVGDLAQIVARLETIHDRLNGGVPRDASKGQLTEERPPARRSLETAQTYISAVQTMLSDIETCVG